MPKPLEYYYGTAVKLIGDNRVGGYLVSFTDPDNPDLDGEHFTAKTNFLFNEYPIKDTAPVFYNHCFDKTIGTKGMGRIDLIEVRADGIYVESPLKALSPDQWKAEQLADSDEYIAMIKRLIQEGRIGWSSGALPQSVKVAENGHIEQWGIIEASLTNMPAGGLQHTRVDMKSLLKEAVTSEEANEIPNQQRNLIQTRNKTMDEQMRAWLDALREELIGIVREVLAGDSTMSANKEDIEVVLDEEDELLAEELTKRAKRVMTLIDDVEAQAKAVKKSLDADRQEILQAVAKRAMQAVLTRKQADLDTVRAEMVNAQKNAPAVSVKGNAYSAGNAGNDNRLTVDEERAYNTLTAGEMALTVKLIMAKVPQWERATMKLSTLVEKGIISEGFVKTLSHKASQTIGEMKARPDDLSKNNVFAMKAIKHLKANELMATNLTNQGAEWVELFYDTDLWERAREETMLFNALVAKGMRVKDVPFGASGMNIKLETGSGTVYTTPEANSTSVTGDPEVVVNPSIMTTDEVTQSLKRHTIAQIVSYQLQEQSVINVAQTLNQDMQLALAEALESALLNGDTATAANTNINLIDGTPTSGIASPLYLAWNGLRKNPLVTNTTYALDDAGSALAAVDYERVRVLFPNAIRTRKSNLLFVVDTSVESKTLRLPEFFTYGAAGPDNTLNIGGVSRVFGIDIYVSGFLGLTNGDGKISATAGNNVKGQIIGVYAPYWQYGRQVQITIEEEKRPMSQASIFVAAVSHLFVSRSAGASTILYDIAVA